MDKQKRYPPEVREWAVRMVFDHTKEHGSQWATICSIAGKLCMTAETLRRRVHQVERNEGLRPGLTSDERTRVKELERENRERKRADEILKSAVVFFGAEIDRRTRR